MNTPDFTRLINEATTPEAAAFWRAVALQALFGGVDA
jgi:hypothetical protein